MGADNTPRQRQANKLKRREKARFSGGKRLLIVCEGGKTEPEYLLEIRRERHLPAANVQIMPSALGTDPLNVVGYARQLFENGDPHKKIAPRRFDEIYAVFDRDAHENYHAALQATAELNGKLRSDLRQPVAFHAIPSVPCFELWLLLHFEDVQHPITRFEALDRIREHLPGYEKGAGSHFLSTRDRLSIAITRAMALSERNSPEHGEQLYCAIPRLLDALFAHQQPSHS